MHDSSVALPSLIARRRLARRGGGVTDVSAFNDFVGAHYTPTKEPAKRKGKEFIRRWHRKNQRERMSAHVKAQQMFKQTHGYDFYDYNYAPKIYTRNETSTGIYGTKRMSSRNRSRREWELTPGKKCRLSSPVDSIPAPRIASTVETKQDGLVWASVSPDDTGAGHASSIAARDTPVVPLTSDELFAQEVERSIAERGVFPVSTALQHDSPFTFESRLEPDPTSRVVDLDGVWGGFHTAVTAKLNLRPGAVLLTSSPNAVAAALGISQIPTDSRLLADAEQARTAADATAYAEAVVVAQDHADAEATADAQDQAYAEAAADARDFEEIDAEVRRQAEVRCQATQDHARAADQAPANETQAETAEALTPIRPRRTHNEEVKLTPISMAAIKYLNQKMESSNAAIGNAIVSEMKESV